MNLAVRSLLTLAFLVAEANAQTGDTAEHPIVKSNLELLDVWLARNAAYQQQPGFAVAVVHGQDVLYAKGFGYADLEKQIPFTENTITGSVPIIVES